MHSIEQLPGEILVIDNHRCLHGRTEFTSTANSTARKLKRIWIRDKSLVYSGVKDQKSEQQILNLYFPYRAVGKERTKTETGIKLDSVYKARYEKILR